MTGLERTLATATRRAVTMKELVRGLVAILALGGEPRTVDSNKRMKLTRREAMLVEKERLIKKERDNKRNQSTSTHLNSTNRNVTRCHCQIYYMSNRCESEFFSCSNRVSSIGSFDCNNF